MQNHPVTGHIYKKINKLDVETRGVGGEMGEDNKTIDEDEDDYYYYYYYDDDDDIPSNISS